MVTTKTPAAAPKREPSVHHQADDDGQYGQLTTLQGWRLFIDDVPVVPDLLDRQEWNRLDDGQRLAYDEARLAHHSRLLVVATTTIRKVITEGRRLSLSCRAETSTSTCWR